MITTSTESTTASADFVENGQTVSQTTTECVATVTSCNLCTFEIKEKDPAQIKVIKGIHEIFHQMPFFKDGAKRNVKIGKVEWIG